jgi:hypothetical protein
MKTTTYPHNPGQGKGNETGEKPKYPVIENELRKFNTHVLPPSEFFILFSILKSIRKIYSLFF